MEDEKLNKIGADLKTNQITFIKKAVTSTFEEIEKLEKDRNALQLKIKILKHDLFDLKDGRLDRVIERQEMAKDTVESIVSVLKVERVESNGNTTNPWYIPYKVTLGEEVLTLNNSIIKLHAPGAYKLSDGSVKYL
jgi:hypothetical protein